MVPLILVGIKVYRIEKVLLKTKDERFARPFFTLLYQNIDSSGICRCTAAE